MRVIKVVVTPFGEARKGHKAIRIDPSNKGLQHLMPYDSVTPAELSNHRETLFEAAAALKEILDELAPGWEDTQ